MRGRRTDRMEGRRKGGGVAGEEGRARVDWNRGRELESGGKGIARNETDRCSKIVYAVHVFFSFSYQCPIFTYKKGNLREGKYHCVK